MQTNRRRAQRSPIGFYVDQYVEDEAFRCFTSNLSVGGVYMERVASSLHRRRNIVQMEMTLPGCNESIWTSGNVIYDRVGGLFHGTAVRFLAMAGKHERLLHDFLFEQRRVESELETIALPSGEMVHIHRPVTRRSRVRHSQLPANDSPGMLQSWTA
jgi:c-di-GMP-binding flagellar brake protein YcgR